MTTEPNYEDDDYNEYDLPQCPHCDGGGEVPCYCGGDFCICDNYGYETCRVCGGEGEVSQERYDLYFENQRKNAELLRAALTPETNHDRD